MASLDEYQVTAVSLAYKALHPMGHVSAAEAGYLAVDNMLPRKHVAG
jgi:hypothetical protein